MTPSFPESISRQQKPLRLGGIATPLGVYMTSGVHTGGVGWQGLVATGALFAGVFYLLQWLYWVFLSVLLIFFPMVARLNGFSLLALEWCFMLSLFLWVLRWSPMAGFHAAEHMTIYAIEGGAPKANEKEQMQESLPDFATESPAIKAQWLARVRLYPREHPRCGTNLTALLGGLQLVWIGFESLRPVIHGVGQGLYILLCGTAVFYGWRSVGVWVQHVLTTKRPTDKQLWSGIQAGQAVLRKFEQHPHAMPHILRRLWFSGLFQIMATYLLLAWALDFWVTPWIGNVLMMLL